MTIRVIDTETTGIDPATAHVIEIASVDLTPTGIANPLSARVALPACAEIPPEASAVHHIIAADLEGAAPFAEAAQQFLGADYYVAHNAAFDAGFLPVIAKPWVCTFKVAMRAWPDAPAHSNQALRYWLGEIEPFGVPRAEISAHSAASDVLCTAAILHRLIAAGIPWSDMLRWSSEPPLFPRWTFGKFRGQPIAACDTGWLQWVLGKADLSEWHHTCRAELAKRSGG